MGKVWARRADQEGYRYARRQGIAPAHGLTIRLNPWVPALAAIRVVDARGGQAMRRLRLGWWSPLPTRYGTGTGSWRRPRWCIRSSRASRRESWPQLRSPYYVGQDAVFLDAFCRAYALALAKSPDQDGLIAFRELLDAAAEELRLHRGYADRWNVDLHQAADPATAAYTTSCWRWLRWSRWATSRGR